MKSSGGKDSNGLSDTLINLVGCLTEALYCSLKNNQTGEWKSWSHNDDLFFVNILTRLETWVARTDFYHNIKQHYRNDVSHTIKTDKLISGIRNNIRNDIKKQIIDIKSNKGVYNTFGRTRFNTRDMRIEYDVFINRMLLWGYFHGFRAAIPLDPNPVQLDAWSWSSTVAPQYFYSLLQKLAYEAYNRRQTHAQIKPEAAPTIPLTSHLINPPTEHIKITYVKDQTSTPISHNPWFTKFKKIFSGKNGVGIEIGEEPPIRPDRKPRKHPAMI